MKDHPRVCGEQSSASRPRTTVIGSPPRVRGTAEKVDKRYRAKRITPACAGNSYSILASGYKL